MTKSPLTDIGAKKAQNKWGHWQRPDAVQLREAREEMLVRSFDQFLETRTTQEKPMHELVKVHKLNAQGMDKAVALAEEFSKLLFYIESMCPAGRDLALAKTHIQDASVAAKRAMASQPENQETAP